jgi:hypothetical protein
MSNINGTGSNGRQSQVDDIQGVDALDDPMWVEYFFNPKTSCAARAAKGAGIEDGLLELWSLGERPDGHGKWEKLEERRMFFKLGESKLMTDVALAWTKEPGRNVVFSPVLYGGGNEPLGMFGLGAKLKVGQDPNVPFEDSQLQLDYGWIGLQDLTGEPTVLLLHKGLIPVRIAPLLAGVLAHLAGDSSGRAPDAWRIPGTLNWPTESQVASGRSLRPERVSYTHVFP